MEKQEFGSRIASVKWKDIVIGYLLKDKEGYIFRYDGNGISDAREQGYSYLIGFKNIKQIYYSNKLFQVFKSRVPSSQRRDIDKILENLGLDEYDEFNILLAQKGKTNTDQITIEEEFDKDVLKRLNAYKIPRKNNSVPVKRAEFQKEEVVHGYR